MHIDYPTQLIRTCFTAHNSLVVNTTLCKQSQLKSQIDRIQKPTQLVL